MIGGLYYSAFRTAVLAPPARRCDSFLIWGRGAAAGPILLALAALPGMDTSARRSRASSWRSSCSPTGLETVLYAGAAWWSQVALLVAIAFWTWLWGPLGLVLSTPLTVCLVVMSKHVPGLGFIEMPMSDVRALTIETSYYQRVIAGDQAEASELIDRFVKTEPAEAVYDAMLIRPSTTRSATASRNG